MGHAQFVTEVADASGHMPIAGENSVIQKPERSTVTFQIPPDLVVKSQAIDIINIILMLFSGSSCRRAWGRNGKSSAELPSLFREPSVTTKLDGMCTIHLL